MRVTAAELAARLDLAPHPEGGFYCETYRSAQTVSTSRGERAASTAILFLVTASAVSRLHRLASDELWVFQGGLPLELVTISPEGELRTALLGVADEPAAAGGESPRRAAAAAAAEALVPQVLVPAGSWQGARLAGGPHLPASRAWALVSCVVTPGFEFDDFELGEREALAAAYPAHGARINELT